MTMENNENKLLQTAPCGFVTIAECAAHREKLRQFDLDQDLKHQELLVEVKEMQQQIKMLLKILSVFSGALVTIATTYIINIIV